MLLGLREAFGIPHPRAEQCLLVGLVVSRLAKERDMGSGRFAAAGRLPPMPVRCGVHPGMWRALGITVLPPG